MPLTQHRITPSKRISSQTLFTNADWTVVDDVTICVFSAGANTWISAFLIDTS